MLHIEQLNQLRALRQQWRDAGETVAFVPTMGNLHSGHLKLVRHASALADHVIVSIYVNPMQFGANEDLDAYPRTLDADMQALVALNVSAVFTPGTPDMYPRGIEAQTAIEVPAISDVLCGASRPGHFRGVATIVNKLFNMVQPDIAVFGKKDYQQLQVIRRMVEDLSMPVDIQGVETEREESGLAKSSRNGYLSDQQKRQAAVIYAQLVTAGQRVLSNAQDFPKIEQQANQEIAQAGLTPEYFSIRRCRDLSTAQPGDAANELVIVAAAKLGTTRLIDNLEVASLK
ncbi:MAG: pantoate--beta-alanine ligase [Idiomarina sp.]|nr:pantoate--beta-alanine ligase [Idiomarina sp.]